MASKTPPAAEPPRSPAWTPRHANPRVKVFISYRRDDTASVASRVYDELRSRLGPHAVFMDTQNIPAGVDYRDYLEQELSQCDVLLAMVGKHWLAADASGKRRLDSAEDYVRIELVRALTRGARVIPVLVDRATMPAEEDLPAELAGFAFRNATQLDSGRDFHVHIDRLAKEIDSTFSRPPGLADEPPLSSQEKRSRTKLLVEIKSRLADRLAQSLHHVAFIDLDKENQPGQVTRPWDLEVKFAHRTPVPLPPGTSALDVFDDQMVAGKLLILGAPGAGKTTTALQLAQELVVRAEASLGMPVPILLDLSSWKENDCPLAGWLVRELKHKYDVRQDIGERWIEERYLLPILDGLDEVKPQYQEACVAAINQFQQESHPPYLVVCCRQAEYENYGVKLELHAAVSLRPLTDEQIHGCLVAAKCPQLYERLRHDAELADLARSPLLLSMMVLAERQGAETSRQSDTVKAPPDLRSSLLQAYLSAALARTNKQSGYPDERIVGWLACLARQLKQRGQTDFLIENLQPDWLPSEASRWRYQLAVALAVATILALILITIDTVFDWVPRGRLDSALRDLLGRQVSDLIEKPAASGSSDWVLLFLNLALLLVPSLLIAHRCQIRPIETIKPSRRLAWQGMILGFKRWFRTGIEAGLCVGLLAGSILVLGFFVPTFPVSHKDAWVRAAQSGGLLAGAVLALLTAIGVSLAARASGWRLPGLAYAPVRTRAWRQALSSAAIVGMAHFGGQISDPLLMVASAAVVACLAGLVALLSEKPSPLVVGGLTAALVGWLLAGLAVWVFGAAPDRSAILALWTRGWRIALPQGFLCIGLVGSIGVWLHSARTQHQSMPIPSDERRQTRHRSPIASWQRCLAVGSAAGLLIGSVAASLVASNNLQAVQTAFLVILAFGSGFWFMLICLAICTTVGISTLGLPFLAVVGGLFNALEGGLLGPDIQRRERPNQGIHQSMFNAAVFFAAGTLLLTLAWSVPNIVLSVMLTSTFPDQYDLLHSLGTSLAYGTLAAILPASAVIQHFVLRLFLWREAMAPLNYARFLDCCTSGLLLQRVGGRYRFMHDLLRDHLAAQPGLRLPAG